MVVLKCSSFNPRGGQEMLGVISYPLCQIFATALMMFWFQFTINLCVSMLYGTAHLKDHSKSMLMNFSWQIELAVVLKQFSKIMIIAFFSILINRFMWILLLMSRYWPLGKSY